MSVSSAQSNFINAKQFAVIGRVLSDRSRWDNKVLRWYQARELAVTPVLPSGTGTDTGTRDPSAKVEGLLVLDDPTKLDDLENTSISIIINPKIGLGILKSLYPSPDNSTPPAPSSSTSQTHNQNQNQDQNQNQNQNQRQTRSQTRAQLGSGPGGPKGIWFQPGAESPDIVSYVKEMGLEGKVIWGGPCILEDGDDVMRKRAKL